MSETTVLCFVTIIISINSIVVFSIAKYFDYKSKKLPSKLKRASKKKAIVSAKNNVAMNAAVDFQKIQTAEIEIPVIAEDVLTYGPGELGAAYPDETNLYYPESAISDKEYLDTIVRSALQVQTHEKNTGEFNRDVDGWPLESWYDATQKRAMLKGILHGEANVQYAKENLSKPGFGTSAYISFLKIRKEKGIAPNGKSYDAIAEKLVNNHVAILPNIRDPKNVIVALNAVQKDEGESNNDDKAAKDEIKNSEDKKMTQDEFNALADARDAKNKETDELKNSIKNEIMEELKKGSETEKKSENAKNEDKVEEKKETESEEKAENTDDKKDDDAEAANALEVSDEMLKDFSTHLGVTFKAKPSLKALGKIVGVEAENTAGLISALNAKRTEITSGVEKTDAKNSQGKAGSLSDFLATV
jgi:hypothetical protein